MKIKLRGIASRKNIDILSKKDVKLLHFFQQTMSFCHKEKWIEANVCSISRALIIRMFRMIKRVHKDGNKI